MGGSRFTALLVVVLAAIVQAASGPGDSDLSFDAGSGVDQVVYALALQADGKFSSAVQ
jgi:hypothetical protein